MVRTEIQIALRSVLGLGLGLGLNELTGVYNCDAKMTTDNRSESKKDVTYGTATVYTESVRNASLESMAKLVRIVGMLLQTKVYLFWSQR